MIANGWLLGRALPQARLRLYCFSHAGGNALQYLPWQDTLGDAIEVRAVQLPARGTRLHEAPYQTMAALVRDLVQVIAADYDGRPYACFGHSLGALVAFELAHSLRQAGLPLPAQLVLSGSAAPWRRTPLRRLHELPDTELGEALRELGGTPPEVLAAPGLMAFLLPAIRADFAIAADYHATPALPLAIPITVFAGSTDACMGAGGSDTWAEAGSAGCYVHWFDGGHFFIHEQHDAVLARLRRCLA